MKRYREKELAQKKSKIFMGIKTGIGENKMRCDMRSIELNASPGKPNEVPVPGKNPETIPGKEPEPNVWPKREPEVKPEREPPTIPPAAPPEVPPPPSALL
jgi:hypothetical protein